MHETINQNVFEVGDALHVDVAFAVVVNASITNTYEWKTWYESCIYSELPEINIVLVRLFSQYSTI